MKPVGFFLSLALATVASAAIIEVNPGNMNGWAFIVETGSGASGSLVNGPGTPPMGTGSAQLKVDAAGDRMILGTLAYQQIPFSAISALSYSTYRASGGSALSLSLQFDVDTDLNDTNTAWMGRLVYEAYYTQVVSDDTWQSWNTMTTGKNWWFSGAPGNVSCNIGSPCTWAEVLTAFPNAGVRAGGFTQFKAGGGWTNFDGNVDMFRIATTELGDNTYNFEGGEVPEPATTALFGAGLAGLIYLRRRG